MGIVICEAHGRAGLVETCLHVAKEIDNRRYGQFYHAGTLLVCEECLHKYHLERFEDNVLAAKGIFRIWDNDELLEAYFEAYEQIQDRTVHCSECIAVAKVEQARRNGEDDPFPTYDKTLNSHSIEVIKELQNLLIENFHFQESIVVENHLAIYVEPGAYTYPLTVKIYYVTVDAEQNRIVNFIDDFFRGHELNQVKIEFFEAEVWETWSNPEKGTSGGKRGEEKLLRKVYLNC
jgi:hypothetical protein